MQTCLKLCSDSLRQNNVLCKGWMPANNVETARVFLDIFFQSKFLNYSWKKYENL